MNYDKTPAGREVDITVAAAMGRELPDLGGWSPSANIAHAFQGEASAPLLFCLNSGISEHHDQAKDEAKDEKAAEERGRQADAVPLRGTPAIGASADGSG